MSYLQILREGLRTYEPPTVPIPSTNANIAAHYCIQIIGSLKSSLWCHNTEKTHYSWSARNYLYGAECRTIQVRLYFHKVLSIGFSNCKLVHFKESYYQKAWHTFLFSLSSTQLMLFCKVSSHSNLKQWITGLRGSFCLGKRSSGKSREERPFYCIWLD